MPILSLRRRNTTTTGEKQNQWPQLGSRERAAPVSEGQTGGGGFQGAGVGGGEVAIDWVVT